MFNLSIFTTVINGIALRGCFKASAGQFGAKKVLTSMEILRMTVDLLGSANVPLLHLSQNNDDLIVVNMGSSFICKLTSVFLCRHTCTSLLL